MEWGKNNSCRVMSLVNMFALFILSTSATAASNNSQAPAFPAPGLQGGGRGGSGTVLPDLFTGTMSYSVPIEVPPGRKGMDPGLSLDYHSNNGNGWVGVGWELELGAIERASQFSVSHASGVTSDLSACSPWAETPRLPSHHRQAMSQRRRSNG